MSNLPADRERTIVVAGYPKSGNTWLTRLTAELVGCPVAGFLGEPKNREIAIEGRERDSEYQVMKAHHSVEELEEFKADIDAVIYIVRDVRDVVVSGAHHFRPYRRPWWRRWLCKRRLVGRWIRCARPMPLRKSCDRMIAAVMDRHDVVPWCRKPWDSHVTGYLDNDYLWVRYEDLLEDPIAAAQRILGYLKISRTDEQIEEAVHQQSFDIARARYESAGDQTRTKFLRRGYAGQWKEVLNKRQVGKLNSRFNETLNLLGYD